MKQERFVVTAPPSPKEKRSLRMMILVGVLSLIFFLSSILHLSNVSNWPLFVLLMFTLLYNCFKYLHEWYHYYAMAVPQKPALSRQYRVDILTTFCEGEPFDMLEQTLMAIQQITYPHTAWCCDEANDPAVKALCERLGVRHITRIDKRDAKAGNINHALRYAQGEICVVLDPDHIPSPDFLDAVVPYFEDPSIGFVQVVQAYYNQHESMVAKGAAQQTYQFYGPMMMTMQSYGTVQAIGANCTFRRSALDSIGGHAAGLAEDMHTAMQMHAKGWKSVYVPTVVSRGLVPVTLSAYYKQQLKWSRGVWELLLITYPKLFRKLSWRQRMHYGTLPFYYLGGFVFLINFLIPVIALFTGEMPLKMDVFSFMLAALPLFSMTVLIRHYVQKWVSEEGERGFHVVGGILQIGTWWVHSMGVIYTFLRKKVPYIPTPKNDLETLPLRLSIPNIVVALVSLAAIVYGLWDDATPYTIFMAGLAFMQVLFMAFIIAVSGYIREEHQITEVARQIRRRNGLIIRTHGFLRNYSVGLSLLVVIAFIFSYRQKQQLPAFLPAASASLDVFYQGIQADPAGAREVPSAGMAIAHIQSTGSTHLMPDTAGLQLFYAKDIIPMLSLPSLRIYIGDSMFSAHPADAVQDSLQADLQILANKLTALNKPLFLVYPRYDSLAGRLVDYRDVCRRIHNQLDDAGATNLIWVWPVGPDTAADAFPGPGYADWLAVNIGDSNQVAAGKSIASFDAAYRPYHEWRQERSALPVMAWINNTDAGWWQATQKTLDTAFSEIHAVIGRSSLPAEAIRLRSRSLSKFRIALHAPLPVEKALKPALAVPRSVRSVVYNTGYSWFRNRHTLTGTAVHAAFQEMKTLGINTVERRMPGFYDHTIGTQVEENHLQLLPSFLFQVTASIIDNPEAMAAQKEKWLDMIRGNQSKKYIIGWKLGVDVLHALNNQMFKPDYFYYRDRFVHWMADVSKTIKLLDPNRPLILQLYWDAGGLERYRYYRRYLPNVDGYALQAVETFPEGLHMPLQPGMYWGHVPVALWDQLPDAREAATIPLWQDTQNTDNVDLRGLLDLDGRPKETVDRVMHYWAGAPAKASAIPEVRILRPAMLVPAQSKPEYKIVYRKPDGRWEVVDTSNGGMEFEWWLVRVDQYGNTLFTKRAATGRAFQLTVPAQPQYYRLYLEAVKDGRVRTTMSTLNTPLRD